MGARTDYLYAAAAGGEAFPLVTEDNWFCLRSQPKHEHIAAAHLKTMPAVAVFLPRIRFQRATRQGLAWVTEALFPNYLFARFNWHESLRQVQRARGVSQVVHFGNRWPVIDPAVISELRTLFGTGEVHAIEHEFSAGDSVRVITGAMHGLQAVVSRIIPSRERVVVLMEFLGRQTSIELSFDAVIKEEDVRATVFSPLAKAEMLATA